MQCLFHTIHDNLITSNKVVTTGTGVGNQTSQLVIRVENDTVCSRRTPTVNTSRAQDGEFIICSVDGEIEALIVVINVWI